MARTRGTAQAGYGGIAPRRILRRRSRSSSYSSSNSSTHQTFRTRVSGFYGRLKEKLPRASAISEQVWKWRCKVFPPKDDGDEDEKEDDKKEVGSEPAVKNLYEGPDATHWNYDWVDYPPKRISKSAARSQDRVAIKVYKIKDINKPCIGGRFPLMHHSIVIQNPALLTALQPILKQQDFLISENEPAKFTPPFAPLWFCKGEIKVLYNKTESSDPLKEYLKLLLGVMEDVHKELVTKKRSLEPSGLIDYNLAWTLFPRGATVYSRDLSSEFLCKVMSASYASGGGCKYLDINAKVLKFNGHSFIWTSKSLKIPKFQGNKPIVQLKHYPVDCSPDKQAIYSRLIARGKIALDLQGLRYHCYNSVALYFDDQSVHKNNVEGRVLIDAAGYHKYKDSAVQRDRKKSKRRQLEEDDEDDWALGGWDDSNSESGSDSESTTDSDSDSDDEEDENNDAAARSRALHKPLSERDCQRNKREMLKREDDLVFIYGLVGGYSLKSKLWLQFYIEDIEPMVWNDAAYSHLVYDEQQKDLIMSFVANHSSIGSPQSHLASSSKSSATVIEDGSENLTEETNGIAGNLSAAPVRALAPMEDVIVGKGQGLIVLLSGPPGTGKTLMAEAVADRTHRPLVYLQAEDLGISASELGPRLKRSLQMAAEWDAVVLLDEADVYMAQRDPNNIHRNELVSIFLRELEYFRGILFLTTNLYQTIDAAFRSRVSLHLIFHSLSREAREKVWRKFLDRLPGTDNASARVESTKKLKQQTPALSLRNSVADGLEMESATSPEGVTTVAPVSEEGEVIPMLRLLDDEDFREISLWQLNGREIKNAVKMVRSWCYHKGYLLTLDKLESGIRVTNPNASKDSDIDANLYD